MPRQTHNAQCAQTLKDWLQNYTICACVPYVDWTLTRWCCHESFWLSYYYATSPTSTYHFKNPLMQDNQSTTRRIYSPTPLLPPSSHQTYINKLESLTMEYYKTTRLATWWWIRPETMDGIHKGQKGCTGREERMMWTALFPPLGFDEVSHDPEQGRK